MKFTKIALAGVLAMTTVLSMVGCGGSGSSGGSSTEPDPNAPVDSMSSDMAGIVANAAKELPKIELANKELKWLCWDAGWNYSTETPEGKLFAEAYGGKVVADTCSYDDRYTVLAQRVSTSDSPDIFPYEAENYPKGIISNMYAPIDDLIDINSDMWAGTKDLMDKFAWGGKHYVCIPYSSKGEFLVYNYDTIEAEGFEDPWKLFEEDKWTWTEFKDMLVKFSDPDNEKYGLGGWWPEQGIIATTGKPFVSLEDGKLVNNLKTPEVTRAMNFLGEINKNKANYPWEKFDWSKKNINYVAEGKTLFYATGEYDLKGTFCNAKKTTAYVENVGIVPFPRDPDADAYYQLLSVDAHMLVVGAPNPEGVKAWQNVRRASKNDEATTKQSREEMKANYGYTDELLDKMEKLENTETFKAIYDFRNGISDDLSGTSNEPGPIIELVRCTFKMGTTWTENLEANYNLVQSEIDSANAKAGN